jgi:hypothetical protein
MFSYQCGLTSTRRNCVSTANLGVSNMTWAMTAIMGVRCGVTMPISRMIMRLTAANRYDFMISVAGATFITERPQAYAKLHKH